MGKKKTGNRKGWHDDAPLSQKEQLFLAYYVASGCENASQAARNAGYKQPGLAGHRLINRDRIKNALNESYKKNAMPIDEILFRLTKQARGSMGDFLRISGKKEINNEGKQEIIETAEVSLLKGKELGALSNIKSIKKTKYGTELQLYDSQAAMSLLLRVSGTIQEERGPKNQAPGVLVAPPTAPTTEAWLEAVRLSQGEPSPPKEGAL